MALVTETGTGSATSESLCDVATADAYHSGVGNDSWLALTTTQKEQALRKATNYMQQMYNGRWQGYRINNSQALDWPRSGVLAYRFYVQPNIVPKEVQAACAELALKASSADLLTDISPQKISATVGDISVTYDKNAPQQKQYSAVESMLLPYFIAGSSTSVRLIR